MAIRAAGDYLLGRRDVSGSDQEVEERDRALPAFRSGRRPKSHRGKANVEEEMSATDAQLTGWIDRLRKATVGLDCLGREFPSVNMVRDMLNDLQLDLRQAVDKAVKKEPKK
jgi:hypothetical protein